MTEKKGFWYWWLTKGSKADIAFKLLFIYSSVITIMFILVIPTMCPDLIYYIRYHPPVGLYYILVLVHGWFICLAFCFAIAIKCEVDEYKEE